ncbi:MAG: hypothetical protein NXI23_01675 [Bacteroidetes bacterium]|jgi:hypothetical protein|nr:hypothetical protein [Bacteroidota bacterium]MDF1863265.1 hypothetical protein [Saprospiraceae bacterium]
MKTKIVLWGTNESDERVLIALALNAKDNKVDIWTFPEKVVTEDFSQKMMREWRNGAEVEFPEEKTHMERELSVTESLLPEELKVERGDVVQRAQTEWHFVVLSSKLNEVYQTELSEIREKIDDLEDYSQDVWENLKGFWNKVQGQVRERNLFREHADNLRDNTNAMFSKMKELRSKMDDDFKSRSQEQVDKITSVLEDLEKKVEDGFRLQGVFEELKKVQRNFRETKLTREHRSHLWSRIDGAFKKVKAKRFGDGAVQDSSPMQRLTRRYEGLIAAIEKMERSIGRDREELDFQKRKVETTDGQLEAQIRQAKILMIEERIRSKEEKLSEMHNTKTELEAKVDSQKQRDAKRAERDAREAAKVAAKEKIAQKIEAASATRDSEKLEKAADAIKGKEDAETDKKEESVLAVAGSMLGESLTDVMDTVKAVAEVVGDKIEEAVEELKEDIKETFSDEKDASQGESEAKSEEE